MMVVELDIVQMKDRQIRGMVEQCHEGGVVH